MKTLEALGAQIIARITIDSRYGWPPECTGILYQPERPQEYTSAQKKTEHKE